MNTYRIYKLVSYAKIILSAVILYMVYINPKNYKLLILLAITNIVLNEVRSRLNEKTIIVESIKDSMLRAIKSSKKYSSKDGDYMKYYKDKYRLNIIIKSVAIIAIAVLLYIPYKQYINVIAVIVVTAVLISICKFREDVKFFDKKMERIISSKEKIKETLEKRNLFDGIDLFTKTSKEYQEKYYKMLEDELNKGE